MTRLVLAFVLVVGTGCGSSTVPQIDYSSLVMVIPPAKPETPGITLKFLGTITRQDCQFLQLRFHNVRTEAVSISGYTQTKPQIIIEEYTPKGWEIRGWDWCGTGVSNHIVAAGESVDIEIQSLWGPGLIRIGVICADRFDAPFTVWSDVIDLRTVPALKSK